MAAGGLVECAPAAQAVRHNRCAGGQPMLGAARNLALAEALDRRQLHLARTPLGTSRDRRHEGRLARRAAAVSGSEAGWFNRGCVSRRLCGESAT